MSLIEEYEEGEYERAPKRLKTMDVEEGEDLEEGEDSDSASAGLLGDEEDATGSGGENRARWSASNYVSGRKVGSFSEISFLVLVLFFGVGGGVA